MPALKMMLAWVLPMLDARPSFDPQEKPFLMTTGWFFRCVIEALKYLLDSIQEVHNNTVKLN